MPAHTPCVGFGSVKRAFFRPVTSPTSPDCDRSLSVPAVPSVSADEPDLKHVESEELLLFAAAVATPRATVS